MVKLKSRTQCPVGGFRFTQPETGASFEVWGFEELVDAIIAHRKGNPRFNLPTDRNFVRAEADLANATRMLSIAGADIYIIADEPPPKTWPRSPRSGPAVVAGARKVASGIGVLLDWLGSGGVPVPQKLADARAEICANCPKNKSGDLTSWFTIPASNMLKRQLEVRGDMQLATLYDDRLGVCDACACPLKLKVHTGIEHITSHMSPLVKAELDPNCWIPKESKYV